MSIALPNFIVFLQLKKEPHPFVCKGMRFFFNSCKITGVLWQAGDESPPQDYVKTSVVLHSASPGEWPLAGWADSKDRGRWCKTPYSTVWGSFWFSSRHTLPVPGTRGKGAPFLSCAYPGIRLQSSGIPLPAPWRIFVRLTFPCVFSLH